MHSSDAGRLALAGAACCGCLKDWNSTIRSSPTEIGREQSLHRTGSEVGVDKTLLDVAENLDRLARELADQGTSAPMKWSTSWPGRSPPPPASSVRWNWCSWTSRCAARARIATKADSAMIIAAGADTRIQTDFSAPTQAIAQQRDGLQQPHEHVQRQLEARIQDRPGSPAAGSQQPAALPDDDRSPGSPARRTTSVRSTATRWSRNWRSAPR